MSGESEDPCSEQVVVAALPGDVPEVHLATLDRDDAVIRLCEANVRGGGDLSLGSEKRVSLAEAGSVDVHDGVVAVLNREGGLIVQMHLEGAEDQKAWAEGLRQLIGGSPAAADQRAAPTDGLAEEDTDEDVVLLQARSRQLQNKIGALEAAGEKQDRQTQKMLRRLDGAMQMLTAVQDMCGQQRKVIAAQQDAIAELRKECGEEADQEEDAEEEKDEEGDAEDEEEGDAKASEMLQLLMQADQMTRALAALESSGPAPPEPPAAAQLAAVPEGADATEEGDEAVLARLMQLQAEKQRFEGMLRDSQQEHEDLLQRLNGMRTLMRSLGVEEGEED